MGIKRNEKWNLKIPKNGLLKLLDESNHAFYWIGFILADGCFNKNCLSLEVSEKDKKHIEKFKTYIESDNDLIYRRNTVTIASNDAINVPLIKDKFDIKYRKTYNPPDVSLYKFNPEQIFSLLIGFIDGDGNIRKPKNGGIQITMENHKSWNKFHTWMEKHLYNYFNEILNKSHQRYNNRGYSLITISKSHIIKLIYNKAIDLGLPLLNRKWDILKN